MSAPDSNERTATWREGITMPFRVLFREGFAATWDKHTLFSVVSVSLLVIVLITAFWWFGLRETPDLVDPDAGNRLLAQTDLTDIAKQLRADEEEWTRIRKEGQRQEEIALAKYRLLCVRQLAARAKDAIEVCRDEATEWTEDMKDFEAASIDWTEPSNRALLGRVDMLLSLDTPDVMAVDDLLDRHETLVAPLQRAEASGEAVPISSDLELSIEELASTAREMMTLLQRRRTILASIVGSATTSTEENLPAPLVALETYRAELADQQQERIDGQLAEAREESEATLLEVEQQAQTALTEAKREAAEIMSRIEVEQTKAEAKRAEELRKVAGTEAQIAADREKLEREFEMDLPKTKHYLQAFLTPDNHHPLKGVTIEKVPYPYSHLESEGALNGTEKGLERFGHIASREAGKRPRGPIADMYNIRIEHLSESQREAIVVAQQLLRKYGLLMVEKKMLLP